MLLKIKINLIENEQLKHSAYYVFSCPAQKNVKKELKELLNKLINPHNYLVEVDYNSVEHLDRFYDKESY